jgi:hypothetical protein
MQARTCGFECESEEQRMKCTFVVSVFPGAFHDGRASYLKCRSTGLTSVVPVPTRNMCNPAEKG